MGETPIYDPELSYEENFARGPFGTFADDRVVGKFPQQQFRDQRLRANIKLQLEIVSFFDVHFERLAEVLADQRAGCASRLNRRFEVWIHN